MEIDYYNEPFSIVIQEVGSSYLPIYLLIADNVYYDSMDSYVMLVYDYLEEYPEKQIIYFFEAIYKDNKKDMAIIEDYKKFIKEINLSKRTNSKDKNLLRLIAYCKMQYKNIFNAVKSKFSSMMTDHNLIELLPFYRNDILSLCSGGSKRNEITEKRILTVISNTIIERKRTISLTNHIDTICPFQTLNSSDKNYCEFLKIVLWKFPFIEKTPYEHLNYIREQLLPLLQPFKDKLKELKEKFFTLDFNSENLPYFKQTISEKINPLQQSIQQAIDENIFLSNLKNKSSENSGLIFCLGIAPAETIVKYYEQIKLIESFEANEMKERISRHINLKSTYIFTYFDIQN